MKKFLLFPCVFLFLFLMSSGANATLIQNGTFDTDLSGWDITGPVTWVSGAAHVGRPGPDTDSSFGQYFEIAAGTSAVNISFDYLWVGNDQTTFDDVFTATFLFQDTSSQWNSVDLVNESNNTGSFSSTVYFEQSVSLSLLSNNNPNGRIEFGLVEQFSVEDIGTRIELDNIVVAPVPEPATMLLFGLGLLGLAGVSRKK